MPEKELTAIICSGAGMKSAHGAGFLHALGTQLDITFPDIMVGSSGDAGNILYFCAGEYERLKIIWTQLLSTPKFISLLRFWRIMDIDYFIDTVLKKQEPMDLEKLKSTSIRWFVPLSDFDTGHTRYVSAIDELDPYEVLRATTAVPIVFGKQVPIAGNRYVDGELGPTLQDHVTHVLRQGAKRILIINHTAPWNSISRAVIEGYAAHIPQGMRDAIVRDISTSVFQMSAPGAEVIVIAPQNLPAGNLTRSQEKLQATFDQGVADALAIKKELRDFFN